MRAPRSVVMLAACAVACAARVEAPTTGAPSTSASAIRPPPPPAGATITDVAKTYVHRTVDPESSMPTVGGWVRVHAPLEDAYRVALRFGEIKDLDPEIEQSTVVDRHPDMDATDVYLRIPTFMHEYVWAVVRFRPVASDAGTHAYRGDEVDGNLDDLRISWRLVADGPNETLAQIELLADPKLPLPRAWLVPQLVDGVRIMLTRFRAKVETGYAGN